MLIVANSHILSTKSIPYSIDNCLGLTVFQNKAKLNIASSPLFASTYSIYRPAAC